MAKDLTPVPSPKGDGTGVRFNMLRELQSATGEELRPFFGRKLLPSVLDKAFKGELRDMSEFKQRKNKFIEQFKYILEKYGKSTALLERFRRVGLL